MGRAGQAGHRGRRTPYRGRVIGRVGVAHGRGYESERHFARTRRIFRASGDTVRTNEACSVRRRITRFSMNSFAIAETTCSFLSE